MLATRPAQDEPLTFRFGHIVDVVLPVKFGPSYFSLARKGLALNVPQVLAALHKVHRVNIELAQRVECLQRVSEPQRLGILLPLTRRTSFIRVPRPGPSSMIRQRAGLPAAIHLVKSQIATS